MVGSLKLVGEGKWSENDLVAALAAADRAACGPVAPPGPLSGRGAVRLIYSKSQLAPILSRISATTMPSRCEA